MMLFSLEARERRQGEKEDSKRTTLAGWLAKSCAMPACLARSCTVYVTHYGHCACHGSILHRWAVAFDMLLLLL